MLVIVASDATAPAFATIADILAVVTNCNALHDLVDEVGKQVIGVLFTVQWAWVVVIEIELPVSDVRVHDPIVKLGGWRKAGEDEFDSVPVQKCVLCEPGEKWTAECEYVHLIGEYV